MAEVARTRPVDCVGTGGMEIVRAVTYADGGKDDVRGDDCNGISGTCSKNPVRFGDRSHQESEVIHEGKGGRRY